MISETELNDEQRIYAGYITESSGQIGVYIKTLIDISRTVAGYQLHLEEFDIADYMERAIMNVIDNASDYSPPEGTVYVSVQKSDSFLQISITDEGNGFTPEALYHAQEQFFMDDHSRTSDLHFGMGLYITNSIIKQHNGQLILKNSDETNGAQVIIEVPY